MRTTWIITRILAGLSLAIGLVMPRSLVADSIPDPAEHNPHCVQNCPEDRQPRREHEPPDREPPPAGPSGPSPAERARAARAESNGLVDEGYDLYLNQRDDDGAKTKFELAVERDRSNPHAKAFLAVIEAKLIWRAGGGTRESAVRALEKINSALEYKVDYRAVMEAGVRIARQRMVDILHYDRDLAEGQRWDIQQLNRLRGEFERKAADFRYWANEADNQNRRALNLILKLIVNTAFTIAWETVVAEAIELKAGELETKLVAIEERGGDVRLSKDETKHIVDDVRDAIRRACAGKPLSERKDIAFRLARDRLERARETGLADAANSAGAIGQWIGKYIADIAIPLPERKPPGETLRLGELAPQSTIERVRTDSEKAYPYLLTTVTALRDRGNQAVKSIAEAVPIMAMLPDISESAELYLSWRAGKKNVDALSLLLTDTEDKLKQIQHGTHGLDARPPFTEIVSERKNLAEEWVSLQKWSDEGCRWLQECPTNP